MSKTSQIKVLNTKGEEVKDFVVPASLLAQNIKPELVHQVVVGYAANRPARTVHIKTRAEVCGGGKKPWRQKGTGRARHGSIRSPLWVGGGVVFGPRNTRNYEQRLPTQLKNQAKKMVIADYVNSGKTMVVAEWPESAKTKEFALMFKALKISGRRTLVLLTDKEKSLRRALNNLPNVEVMAVKELNAYDGMRWPRWLVSEAGAAELIKMVS